MNKFFINCFDLKLDLKKVGIIKIKTAIKKKSGINWSNATINYSKSLLLFEKIF